MIPSDFDEPTNNQSMFKDLFEFVREQSKIKLGEQLSCVKDAEMIITADAIDNRILWKPRTHEKA